MSEQTKNAHLLTPKHLEYFGNVGKINSNIPLNAVSASIHVHIHQGIYMCVFCNKFTKTWSQIQGTLLKWSRSRD